MFSHDEIRQLISQYFDNETSPEEKDIVEEHILGCDACKAYYQQLSRIQASLRSMPDEDLSPDLEQKIKHGLAKAQHREEEKMKPLSTKSKFTIGATVVVALLALTISMQTYSQRAIQARIRGAAQYLADATLQGRLKSATDDIGDQFSTQGMDYQRVEVAKKAGAPIGWKDVATTSAIVPAAPQTASSGLMKPKEVNALSAKKDEMLGEGLQYEPYYLNSSYEQVRNDTDLAAKKNQPTALFSLQTRAAGGYSASTYDMSGSRVAAAPIETGGYSYRLREAETISAKTDYYRAYPQYYYPPDTEEYGAFGENRFLTSIDNPLSTFSIDVDTASYSNIRRFLNEGNLPPDEAVRIEEMINYFKYDYPKPSWNDPFSITTEVSQCPWAPDHQLVLVGLQGKVPDAKRLAPRNLVFLLDVSGSMADWNKLPFLKIAFLKLVDQLRAEDRVSVVIYSSSASVIIDSVPGDQKWNIRNPIMQLQANGSTAGWEGLQLAYSVAWKNFIPKGNNRVIIATDGDFNVGPASDSEIVGLIEQKRQSGIFLTVLGLGSGNLKDCKLVQLADKGNGNYFYLDTQEEADKVFGKELGSTLFTIAKDVKIQVEFNPSTVKAYRLVGYEKRKLAKEDFNNDAVDAGEIGAGHTVTALYEIVPNEPTPWVVYRNGRPEVDPLKYQKEPRVAPTKVTGSRDLMTVKVRYKEPDRDTSRLIERAVGSKYFTLWPESNNFRWAAAVAEFGLLLKNSPYKANASYEHVIHEASQAIGSDVDGYRRELIELVRRAQSLDGRPVRYIEDEYRYADPSYPPYRYRNEEQPKIQFK